MKVEIYSDIVCPWCYIGKRRFERAAAAYPGADDIETVFRPFQLDPTAPLSAIPLLEYLNKRFGGTAEQMTRQLAGIAAEEEIEIDWSRALAANTLEAHKLLSYVEREHGVEAQKALVDKLFAAHFARGLNIGDREVLAQIASEVGADAEAARSSLDAGADTPLVLAEIAQAREMGVKAVPTFIFDGIYMVEGAQSPATFSQVLDQVATKARERAAAGSAG